MVINFFDVLIIDSDTISFLLSIFPDLRTILLIAAVLAGPGRWSICGGSIRSVCRGWFRSAARPHAALP